MAGASETSGVERVFLVRGWPDGKHGVIEGFHSRCKDAPRRLSRTVLRRALSETGSFVCPAGARDGRLLGGASVRELALRCIVSAAVPQRSARRRALILDSRTRPVWSPARLRDLAEAFAALVALTREPERAQGGGGCTAWAEMLDWVRRVAAGSLPVLVRGETGSGKERVARAVHDQGPRRSGPFVAVNCTALPESLLEAELFGAVRGAYTGAERDRGGLFQRADGGTLFLDEVGEMSPAMQVKLLRAIEERQVRPVGGDREVSVDVRVVTATHRDLAQAVRSGTFRADLFHRIGVLEVRVPPLRERLSDLPRLVSALGERLTRETCATRVDLAADAWDALHAYTWPGNVRELHAVLARGVLRAEGGMIRASHLRLGAATASGPRFTEPHGAPLERTMIQHALRASAGNITRAAERIGWTRQKLYRRMRALRLGRAAA